MPLPDDLPVDGLLGRLAEPCRAELLQLLIDVRDLHARIDELQRLADLEVEFVPEVFDTTAHTLAFFRVGAAYSAQLAVAHVARARAELEVHDWIRRHHEEGHRRD